VLEKVVTYGVGTVAGAVEVGAAVVAGAAVVVGGGGGGM
jgi:hypothetical protein